MSAGKYLITIWKDVEPELHGPFDSDEARDVDARSRYHSEDGIFQLDIDNDGKPSIASYSGAFFDDLDDVD